MPSIIPKKRFGQHFLKDQNIIRKIVTGAGLSADDVVLEIGPGLGDMTALLAQTAHRVIAVEVDRDLYSVLIKRFEGSGKVEIMNADALKFSIKGLFDRFGKKLKVVANLPYNISTPLLFKFFEERDCISSMTLMFQKEVGDRLVAPPGTKDYGVLSIYAQLYTRPSVLLKVPPHAFTPPPKIDSVVVRLDVLPQPSVKANAEGVMLRVVKAAFGQRRKTLSNALRSGLGLSKEAVESALKRAGVDGSRRGETLTLTEFCSLSDAFWVELALFEDCTF